MKRVFESKSIYELDKYFISKQFTYATVDEYYEDSSIDSKIADIRVPTLFLHAADDMFCPRTGTIFYQTIMALQQYIYDNKIALLFISIKTSHWIDLERIEILH
jgi:predicted alpha/beta-fold hydrolase